MSMRSHSKGHTGNLAGLCMSVYAALFMLSEVSTHVLILTDTSFGHVLMSASTL